MQTYVSTERRVGLNISHTLGEELDSSASRIPQTTQHEPVNKMKHNTCGDEFMSKQTHGNNNNVSESVLCTFRHLCSIITIL